MLGIKRVDKLNVLGITFHNHVDAVVEKSVWSLYTIETIRAHGLYGNALWDVTGATLVAQLLYASPAWRTGFLKQIKKPSSVCGQKGSTVWVPPHHIQNPGWVETGLTWKPLLFIQVQPHHVLHRLLPPPKDTGHMLCQRAHNLTLPSDVSFNAKQNFIPGMLFADMYWTVSRMNELYYWTLLKFISHMSKCMFYRQHCAKRKAPVFTLLRGGFWHVAPIGVKFGTEEGTPPPCQISPQSVRRLGIGPQNWNICWDLIKMCNVNAPQGRIPCAIFTNFAEFVKSFRMR